MDKSLSVLIVEDERLISMMFRKMLEKGGFTVCGIAPNLMEAYEIIENRSPDFVLIDIHLEGDDNGITLGRKLRKDAKIPFAYVSAYSDKITYDEAMETKPITSFKARINRNNKNILNDPSQFSMSS